MVFALSHDWLATEELTSCTSPKYVSLKTACIGNTGIRILQGLDKTVKARKFSLANATTNNAL